MNRGRRECIYVNLVNLLTESIAPNILLLSDLEKSTMAYRNIVGSVR